MKRTLLTLLTFLILCITTVNAQLNVGVNTAADASAMLQVSGSNRGFRPPQVNLTSTTTFGLTAPTVGSQSLGMIVYNNNSSISGTTAYPAYGVGIYSWDGTGWISPYNTSIVEVLASGNVSAAAVNNALVPLDLSKVIIQAADIQILTSNTVVFNTTGTYRIEVTCEAKPQANLAAYGAVMCYPYKNGIDVGKAAVVVLPVTGGSNSTLPYKISRTLNVSATAGDQLILKGLCYGFGAITCTFQVRSLQITRLQ